MHMIFPMIQSTAASPRAALPLAREVAFDFSAGIPIFRGGVPVIVTGLEAVKVWAWKTLHTWRYRHPIYSHAYGNDAFTLIGRAYSEALKTTEAARYVRECLTVSRYITDVTDVAVEFSGDLLTISCRVKTIYGEVNLNV